MRGEGGVDEVGREIFGVEGVVVVSVVVDELSLRPWMFNQSKKR